MNPPQTPPPPNFSQKPKFHIFFLKPSLKKVIGKGKSQDCKKRSLNCVTWCETCKI